MRIQFFETFLAQAVAVILFQIRLSRVGELHLDAPAVDGVHALKFFSAAGTGLFHSQKSARPPYGGLAKNEYQLFKQHCTGNKASLERSQQQAIAGITVHRTINLIALRGISDIKVAGLGVYGHVVEQAVLSRSDAERLRQTHSGKVETTHLIVIDQIELVANGIGFQ